MEGNEEGMKREMKREMEMNREMEMKRGMKRIYHIIVSYHKDIYLLLYCNMTVYYNIIFILW
jgi:hypothetical protein